MSLSVLVQLLIITLVLLEMVPSGLKPSDRTTLPQHFQQIFPLVTDGPSK